MCPTRSARCDQIFVGKVVDVRTRWGDLYNMIWTDYEFEVVDVWSGDAGRCRFVVSVAGGTVGEKTILVSEVPQFTRGGTYIVFGTTRAGCITRPSWASSKGCSRK